MVNWILGAIRGNGGTVVASSRVVIAIYGMLLSVSLPCSWANAEVHHGMAGYYTSVNLLQPISNSGLDFDNSSANAFFPNTIYRQPELQTAEGYETHAFTSNFAPELLGVSAFAGLQRPSGVQLDNIAYSVAGWSDGLKVTGIALPATVRLNFELQGRLAAITAYSNSAVAIRGGNTVPVQDATSPLDPASGDPRNVIWQNLLGPVAQFSGGVGSGNQAGTVGLSGWDNGSTATVVPSVLNGNPGATDAVVHLFTHFDLAHDASGVYPFQVYLLALAEETLYGDNAYVEAANTLALVSITLPDGTTLSSLGATTTFESGLAFPTPEPSSLILGTLGLIGFAAWVWRRKR